MTPLNLDQLLRVADEATPGPWERIGSSVTNWHDHTFEMEWMPNGCGGECDPNANWEADATFIATFDPPTVKALIEQNRALVEALRELWLRTASGSDEQRVAALSAAGDLLATVGALLSQEEDA